jgi:VIT1/CCC1 family predicted Fe2+/Mn2+ transporter
MKHSVKIGFSFGTTSGIITTLGLMVGLYSGTHSRLAVIGGILTIAIADALSDALGIHISEESENKHTPREIWLSTLSTLLCKFIIAITFVVPVLLFSLTPAIIISLIWGLLLLAVCSYFIVREQKKHFLRIILEHEFIALLVISATYFLGKWIGAVFN